ncbi:Histone-lysine N-methyltransferase SETMAR-like protein [Aphelenchoides fujianensis]|nr:Histone-lysine N-methyltransferase SETMAR-like protein [Aphelenchoides fujianensis]
MLRNDRMRVRSVMLAEFERGANEERAFARVCLEFGPKAITRKTLEKWFEKFRKGDTSLADRRNRRQLGGWQSLSADRFAAIQRAFCGTLGSYFSLDTFVFDGRFMISSFMGTVRMIDLYYSKEMPLNFDVYAALPPTATYAKLEEFRLVDVRRALCRLKFEVDGQQQRSIGWCSWDFEEWQVVVDGPLVSLTTGEEYPKPLVQEGGIVRIHYVVCRQVDGWYRDFYQCVQLKGGRFEVAAERVELPENLHEPFFLFYDGHLFAFERSAARIWNPNFRKLLKISPTTGQAIKLPTCGWLEENGERQTSQVWIGTTLIVRCEPEVNGKSVHRLWAFDLHSLQWRQLELDFADELPILHSDEENILFVHGYKSKREKNSLYRFPIK